jgi:asparagine synthase (glutamine-hydrolysing)
MCGILGQVSQNIDESFFVENLKKLNHRGPDNSSTVIYENLILGHTRLSIIDLDSRSDQPFELDNFSIVFNGEIYNYLELKEELVQYGMTFKTNSDTEVILNAYKFWGEEFLNKMNGMWSFVIYDKYKETIILSRDRFGVKPLYYYLSEDAFIFSSEIKSILPYLKLKAVSRKEIIRYLIYGAQEHREETLFLGIKRFPKGSIGKYNLKSKTLKIREFYHLKTGSNVHTEIDVVKKNLRRKLDQSVKIRLRSDVEVAIALSGGIDSNIITFISNNINNNLKSFTATYLNAKEINENNLTDKTVKKLALNHVYKEVNIDEYIDKLEKIIWYHDEPFDTMGMIAQFSVFQSMKENNVKVSLDGQGADEIFGGYKNYMVCIIKKHFFNPFFHYKYFSANDFNQIINNYKLFLVSLFPSLFERLYFKKRARKVFNNSIKFISSKKKMFEYPSNLNAKLNYDIDEHLPVLLKYADRNSMANSVESRAPFMDYNLINYSIDVSPNLKFKNGYLKYILRETFDSHIDENIIWNKLKKGFPVPQKEWLDDERLIKKFNTFINASVILKKLNINMNLDRSNPIYWRIINLAIWEKTFEVTIDENY